jgi:hypothetical protein
LPPANARSPPEKAPTSPRFVVAAVEVLIEKRLVEELPAA